MVVLLAAGCAAPHPRCENELPKAPTTTTLPRPMADEALADARYALAIEFIRWFESRYIDAMQRVGGMSTDVADTVKQIGMEKTVARYAANRRAELDYAMAHRGPGPIPQSDLDRITRDKYEGVIANVTSSGKWIDYGNPEVTAGIRCAYEQKALAWIPFYRHLLCASVPARDDDFRALIRKAMARNEYEKTVEASLRGTEVFYASLRKGVTWYAPWAPMIKHSLDSAMEKDRALWRATVSEIYGQGPTARP